MFLSRLCQSVCCDGAFIRNILKACRTTVSNMAHYSLVAFTLIWVINLILLAAAFSDNSIKARPNDTSSSQSKYGPHSPYVKCSFLPEDFIRCEEPQDLKGNKTLRDEIGYGCLKMGGQRYESVEKTKVKCEALPGIECEGDREFQRDGVPCIKYSGHYFTTTLIYSILLGFLGMDRFCLGHTGTAVGKLLTLGGVGIWWIVDIVLLVSGGLMPEDGSNWEPVL